MTRDMQDSDYHSVRVGHATVMDVLMWAQREAERVGPPRLSLTGAIERLVHCALVSEGMRGGVKVEVADG